LGDWLANRRRKRMMRELRRAGISVHEAYCTECDSWYDVRDKKQVNRHAH
jgi:hypothetical protein